MLARLHWLRRSSSSLTHFRAFQSSSANMVKASLRLGRCQGVRLTCLRSWPFYTREERVSTLNDDGKQY